MFFSWRKKKVPLHLFIALHYHNITRLKRERIKSKNEGAVSGEKNDKSCDDEILNDVIYFLFSFSFTSHIFYQGVGAKCHYDSDCIENSFCRHQLLCFCKKEFWVMSDDHWNCKGMIQTVF